MFTGTQEAEGMAKLILKGQGDGDQVLAMLKGMLYYSLLIYKDELSIFLKFSNIQLLIALVFNQLVI